MPKARAKEKNYPSDLTEEQFAKIRALLESSRAKTKPLGTDLRALFNAVLYLLKEGCRWRSLPHDYPNWQTVYYHYNHWRSHVDKESGLPLLELVLKKKLPPPDALTGGTRRRRS
jgi:hypothetical protein